MTPTPPKHFLSGWAMKLTILRMVLIPLFIFTYYCHPHSWGQWLSLGVYTIACLSDFFDGWLARHLKEESAFGAFLDPVADKLMVAAVLIVLIKENPSIWLMPKDVVRGWEHVNTMVFNIWTVVFLPLGIALFAYLIDMQERKAGGTTGDWHDYYGKVQWNGGIVYRTGKLTSAFEFAYLGKRIRDYTPYKSFKSQFFTDLNFSYQANENARFFLNIDNLFNRHDIISSSSSTFYNLGRNFLAGVEYKF